jgi:hypothetical protein
MWGLDSKRSESFKTAMAYYTKLVEGIIEKKAQEEHATVTLAPHVQHV